MNDEDYPLFRELIDLVGWGLTRLDYNRFISYNKTTGYKARLSGKTVGMVFSFLYDETAWIGNLVVLPTYRGRGIGEALMKNVMNKMKMRGAKSIRLDSVPKAESLYKRLGFKREHLSLRYVGTSKTHVRSEADRMKEEDIKEVIELDKRFFGYNRGEMLKRVLEDHPNLCFTASSDNEIIGYIMGKEGKNNIRIGPWICTPGYREHAERLLESIMKTEAEESLWAGLPEPNQTARKILENHGFRRKRSSIRICHGICEKKGDVMGVYGVGGPEKG